MNRIYLSISAALLLLAVTATAQNTPPVVTNQIADFTSYAGAPARSIDLTTAFADPDVSNVVRLGTVLGAVDVALFGQQKPITVANFLNYVNQGRYFKIDPTNGQLASSFVHRAAARIRYPRAVVISAPSIRPLPPLRSAHSGPSFSRDPKRARYFEHARNDRDGENRQSTQQRDERVVHQSREQRWPAQQSRYRKRRLHCLREGREQRNDGR